MLNSFSVEGCVVQVAAAGLCRCVIALHHCLQTMCIQSIHNSASLRGVCADTPLSFASLVYLLHIHNSAAPRLCICAYTILSSDVRHYYIIEYRPPNPII